MVNGTADKETSGLGREGIAVCPKRPYLLGVHSSIGGAWGHGQGGMPFFL